MLEYCRIYLGQHQPMQRLIEQLVAFDYRRVGQVEDAGDIAVHGGVLDVFPATFESPLRIEFDGSRIGSMRSFNPQTLDTLDHHTMIVLLQGALLRHAVERDPARLGRHLAELRRVVALQVRSRSSDPVADEAPAPPTRRPPSGLPPGR